MKYFLSFLDWFLPPDLKSNWDFGELQKARMIISAGLTGTIVPFLLLKNGEVFPEAFMPLFYSIWAISLTCLASFKILRLSLMSIGKLTTLSLTGILCGFTIIHEVFFSATFGWFTSSVIISVFMVGWRWGLLNLFFCLSTLIYAQETYPYDYIVIPKIWDPSSFLINFKNDQNLSLIFNTTMILIFLFTKEKSERDLLESKNKIIEQQEELFKKSRMAELGKVAGGIAHEINNPLTVIKAHSQKLKRLVEDNKIDLENLTKSSEKIDQTCDRITRIVNGLRKFSRDGSADPLEATSLKMIIEEAIDVCEERLHMQSIQLDVTIPKRSHAMARYTQLFQVLINLMNNAMDALKECEEATAKTIQIKVEKLNQETVSISIIDSGVGVPDDIVDKIFNSFFTTKPVGQGTGLGLSISKEIITQMGGDIFYDKSHGDSRFVIELKAA